MDKLRSLACFDQSRRAQLFDVVRQRRRRDRQLAAQVTARQFLLPGNAREDLVASGVRQHLRDSVELCSCHSNEILYGLRGGAPEVFT